MMKRMIIMVLIVLLIVGFIGWRKYAGFQQLAAMKTAMASTKQTVSATKATLEEWREELHSVGSVRAAKGVDVTNEIAGIVDTIHFNSGGDVKAGDLLISLRAADDIAKLQALEAAEKLAEINYTRDKKQLQVQAVSRAMVDADAATLASDKAQVAEQKAVVEKKFIRAPFSGHLGIRNVDLGQYLNAGTPIVTLQQLDPVYLDFTLPQQAVAHIATGQKIAIKSDVFPDKAFMATLSAINPKVDSATRNVQVRAILKNNNHALLPGMYANANITVGEPQQFVTLPQTSITYNPYGNTVFLVKEKDKDKDKDEKNLVVEQSFVTVGRTRGDQVQILKGVKEGDTVVSAGQLKLQNGAAVTIDNSVALKDDANPQPQDQ